MNSRHSRLSSRTSLRISALCSLNGGEMYETGLPTRCEKATCRSLSNSVSDPTSRTSTKSNFEGGNFLLKSGWYATCGRGMTATLLFRRCSTKHAVHMRETSSGVKGFFPAENETSEVRRRKGSHFGSIPHGRELACTIPIVSRFHSFSIVLTVAKCAIVGGWNRPSHKECCFTLLSLKLYVLRQCMPF